MLALSTNEWFSFNMFMTKIIKLFEVINDITYNTKYHAQIQNFDTNIHIIQTSHHPIMTNTIIQCILMHWLLPKSSIQTSIACLFHFNLINLLIVIIQSPRQWCYSSHSMYTSLLFFTTATITQHQTHTPNTVHYKCQ